MEFIYSAFNNTETIPIKGKISKWRHLETTVTQLVLLGLLLFLIMQNGNLKKQISDKLSHEIVEDILTEKMVQVTKEMDEFKMLLLETSNRNSLQAEELKKILKILIKEIGFPLPITTLETAKSPFNTEYYEIFQEYESDHSSSSSRPKKQSKREIEEEDFQEYSEDEENSEDNDEGDEVSLQESENETEAEDCNYLGYLGKAATQEQSQIGDNIEDQEDNSQERDEEQDSLDEKMNRKSNQTEDEDEEEIDKDYRFRTYLTLFKTTLIVGGNVLLVFLAFVCLFILRSVIKNPKYRSKSEETFENILKVGSKGKEHHSHSMPQKKILSL